MHPPEPKEFGVNPKDIGWAEKIRRSLPLAGFVVSAIACTYALMAFHIGFPMALLLFTPTMILLLIMTAALIRPFDLVLQLLMPRYRRAQRYRKALAMFRAWWVRTQEEFWLSLSGLQFEAELAAVFRRAGFRAELTAVSGDKGVDIWLYTKRGKEIVQCKAHSGPIGPAVARELYGTLQHFGAPAATLASTSGFTKGVRAFARNKPIVLMDLRDIIALQERNSVANSVVSTDARGKAAGAG
jgi:hypothetical protein